MAGPRNPYGYNDMAQLYRTVDGVRFQWTEYPATGDRLAAWRKAGVRVRQFRIDGQPELFIHPDDISLADQVELAARGREVGERG